MPISAKCPHCSETHVVDGFAKEEVEEKIKTRIKAKNDEIALYQAKIADLQKVDVDTIARERDEAVRELATIREASAVAEAFGSVGITADDALRGAFRTIYDSATAGKEDRPSFAEWVQGDDAKNHVLLRAHYPAPPAPGTKPPPAPKPPPSTENGTAPAGTRDGKLSPADLRAYFASPEYRALPKEERAAKMAELQAAHLPAPGA